MRDCLTLNPVTVGAIRTNKDVFNYAPTPLGVEIFCQNRGVFGDAGTPARRVWRISLCFSVFFCITAQKVLCGMHGARNARQVVRRPTHYGRPGVFAQCCCRSTMQRALVHAAVVMSWAEPLPVCTLGAAAATISSRSHLGGRQHSNESALCAFSTRWVTMFARALTCRHCRVLGLDMDHWAVPCNVSAFDCAHGSPPQHGICVKCSAPSKMMDKARYVVEADTGYSTSVALVKTEFWARRSDAVSHVLVQ